MNTGVQNVVEAALKLPESERAEVARELIRSLSPQSDSAFDDTWLAEIDRRVAEFEQGIDEGIPWSELKQRS